MIELIRNLAKVFIVLLVGIPTAFAGEAADIRAGNAALEAKDYQTAIHKFLPLAIDGNAEAQFQIARMYGSGKGLRNDKCASTIWAEKAARQGHPAASLLMSFAYEVGGAVRRNYEMAYRWMSYADQLGDSNANGFVDYMARHLTPAARAKIDEDMKTWDPSKLPRPEFFIIGGNASKSAEFYADVLVPKGVGGCYL